MGGFAAMPQVEGYVTGVDGGFDDAVLLGLRISALGVVFRVRAGAAMISRRRDDDRA